MKGIILAGGNGTRLSPLTIPTSKILLPVYDRPMIYYPLATLMEAGIRDILVITNERNHDEFVRTLGDGSQFGVKISYVIQYVQRGISDAFIIGKEFVGNEKVVLILGDNLFLGDGMNKLLHDSVNLKEGSVVFGYRVKDPERFGVAGFDSDMKVTSLEEKPKEPKSDCAVVGLYFYDGTVCDRVKLLKPSARGELEVTDLNRLYLDDGKLGIKIIGEDVKWFDTGTFDSLLEASEYVRDIERKNGRKINCPELVAYEKKFITKEQLVEWLDNNKKNEYFQKIRESI